MILKKEMEQSIKLLSREIRIYDFKEIEQDNGYIGIDIVQTPLFLQFYKRYSEESGYKFYIEIDEKKYDFSVELLNILNDAKSFFLYISNGIERASIEVLIGDFKNGFLIFRSSNIPYKKQRYIDRDPFGYISLKELNRQYFPSNFHFEKPIDIVYTWVDSNDKGWQKLFSQFKDISEINHDRFMSIDELKYSLRSIEKYAPWVNKIYIVSNCQPPKWLKAHPQIEWIDHSLIFKKDELPTFNSHALGLTLYKIPNLSEHFIYFNDDVFLYNRVKKEDFFTPNGLSISYLEPYGMIYHSRAEYEKEDYFFSALNGKKLLEEKYHFSPTQLHRHVPLAFNKSILIQMENLFKENIERTRKNRFRDRSDVSVSFLYNHYALYHREAVFKDTDSILVNFRNYQTREKSILKRRPKFICINDGEGSSKNIDYKNWTLKFLENSFPKRVIWERKNSI